MLPINFDVDRQGRITANIIIKPHDAKAWLTLAKNLAKAAHQSLEQQALIKARLKIEREEQHKRREHGQINDRLALSLFRKTNNRKLVAQTYNIKLGELDYIMRQCTQKKRAALKLKQVEIITSQHLKGFNAKEIGLSVGLHEKSVLRILKEIKQGELF